MPFLASDVTAEARDHLTDFYKDGDPRTLRLVNQAHQDILRACALTPLETLDLPLVAGTGEYDLDPTVVKIVSATYKGSSADYSNVWAASVDELNETIPTWREHTPSRPYRYYEQGGRLGLYPSPDRTTSAGFPVVRLQALRVAPLAGLSDALPTQLPNIQAFVWQVCALWCIRENDDPGFAKYSGLAKGAMLDLRSFVDGRMQNTRVRVVPSFRVPRNR